VVLCNIGPETPTTEYHLFDSVGIPRWVPISGSRGRKSTNQTMAEHAAMPQGVQIVTLEPSDFPRLCCEPHLLESWRIHLPR